jgi:hypothetical protein
MLKPYMIVAVLIGLIATHAETYLKGHKAGSTRELAKCQAQRLQDAQDASRALEAIQQQLREREIEWAAKQQEAADAIATVRVEYLPGKTIVKREIVREPRYRDCAVSPGMRDTLNAALAGRPVPGAAEVGTDTGRLPADA